MRQRQVTAISYESKILKQHLNRLRNNTSTMLGLLTWKCQDADEHDNSYLHHHSNNIVNKRNKPKNIGESKKRKVSFDISQNIEDKNKSPIR